MNATFPQNSAISQSLFDDKKTALTAMLGVIALHGMLAVGLAHMTVPKIAPPKVTPPLEVTFTQVAPPPPEIVEPEIEPEPKVEPTPVNKPEPKVEQKLEPIKKEISKPVEKPIEKPIEKKIEPKVETVVKKEDIKEDVKKEEKVIPPEPKLDQNLLKAKQLAEQNERAEKEQQQRDELAKQQAEAAKKQADDAARQKALDDAKAAKEAADRVLAAQQDQAKRQAEAAAAKKRADDAAKQKALDDAKAKKDAEDKAQKAAQSNTPFTFSAGQASWRRAPTFTCSSADGESLSATVRYVADKQGSITSVSLAKSTGNSKADKEIAMQARSGRFNPFTKNGVPVVGIVFLPVRCQ